MAAVMPGLVVSDLLVAYGGNLAVDGLSLEAPVGRITGLIGPNGAGKTTSFNACSGLVRATSGTVELFGQDVTRRGTEARARMGLGRTFQRAEICVALTVRANIGLGLEARLAGRSLVRQIFSTRSQRHAIGEATEEVLDLCHLDAAADERAAILPAGQRRLLELARVLAGGFQLLLMDEPSSGLDDQETREFGQILQRVMTERDIGILIVEHDMSLVMGICEYIHVLDFGKPIFDGTPDEVQSSSLVRAAYLGTDEPSGALR